MNLGGRRSLWIRLMLPPLLKPPQQVRLCELGTKKATFKTGKRCLTDIAFIIHWHEIRLCWNNQRYDGIDKCGKGSSVNEIVRNSERQSPKAWWRRHKLIGWIAACDKRQRRRPNTRLLRLYCGWRSYRSRYFVKQTKWAADFWSGLARTWYRSVTTWDEGINGWIGLRVGSAICSISCVFSC